MNNKDTNQSKDNPYFDNKKDFNDRVAIYKANASMWRVFGLISLLICGACIGGLIYIANQPKTVPFLFKEDGSGGITALGIPNTVMRVDNKLIANQLATFIIALRQVPVDLELRKQYVRRVKMMTTSELFNNQLVAMFKSEYKNINSDNSIKVSINTIEPIAKNTWQIDWTQSVNSIATGKYSAIVTYERDATITDPTLMIFNPLGIIIKDININTIIGS